MVHFIIKSVVFKRTCICVPYIKLFKRNYVEVQPKSEKTVHPYKQIHHWKSIKEFAEDIFNNIIFHRDGLVVVNKPYGIRRTREHKCPYGIPSAVNYSLEDALPYISQQLEYPHLTIVRCPEMYMSGIALLSANIKIQHALELSMIRTKFFYNKYWIITTDIPSMLSGNHRLAMKAINRPNSSTGSKAVIVTSWSSNEEKRKKVKLLETEYRVLSKSILNLCALIEITTSTRRWHAIRLYASTFLYCPILGDNLCGSLVQKVGNTYVKVDPFLKDYNVPPALDKRLLSLLNLSEAQRNIIPTHIHLKSIMLPYYFGETVKFDAPLMPPFDWTCKQLEFKCFIQNK